MTLTVRTGAAEDAETIEAVHAAAFPTPAEAELVAALDADGDCEISMVAEERGRIVAHLMLSRMTVEGERGSYRALGLGPVAVLPERQRRGIGSRLIEHALSRAEADGAELIFVLGDPGYYGRFGFSTETAERFRSPYAGEHFMARARPGIDLPGSGRADYAPAFARLD